MNSRIWPATPNSSAAVFQLRKLLAPCQYLVHTLSYTVVLRHTMHGSLHSDPVLIAELLEFGVFKRWKAMIENETNLKLKCLRSDNGGEYIDGDFKRYCADNGIKTMKTIPGTSQQNGIAKMMNQTLNERARSMRIHAGLPKTFWADAINTAAFLINREPSVPLSFKIPEEAWSDKK